MKKDFKIQIPNEVVRDKNLKSIDFLVLLNLIHEYHIQGAREMTVEIYPIILMELCNIKTKKTLIASVNRLYEQGYILNNIESNSYSNGIMTFLLTDKLFAKNHFTQLTSKLINIDFVRKINANSIRLIYYYESFINRKDRFKNKCFRRVKDIMEDCSLSKTSVINVNSELERLGCIRVHRFKAKVEYIGDEGVTIDRQTNNYIVLENNIINMVDNLRLR